MQDSTVDPLRGVGDSRRPPDSTIRRTSLPNKNVHHDYHSLDSTPENLQFEERLIAIKLFMLMIDSLAPTLKSSVRVDIKHAKDCRVFTDTSPDPMTVAKDPIFEDDLLLPVSCTCDVTLEAVFTETDVPENTLLLSITLNQFMEKFPWINDTEGAAAMLHFTAAINETRALCCLHPMDFNEAMGLFFTQIEVSPKMCTTKSHIPMYKNNH